MADDLKISGSEAAVNLTGENVQVPAPPIEKSVEQLEIELSELRAFYNELKKGFVKGKTYTWKLANGDTKTAKFSNEQLFDAAKANSYDLLKKTLPAQISQRKAWEDKYSLRQEQKFGPDYVVLTAGEVYDIQQRYKVATNPNDKELKAYDDAVAEAQAIEKRISTPGTYEAGLSPSEQQLVLATAWKKVMSKITQRVQEYRSQDIPIIVDEYGRTTKSTQFYVAPRVETTIDQTIDRALAEADKEFSTVVPEQVDRFGRVLTNTTIRDQEQSRQLAAFTDRANKLRAATPAQAEQFVQQQPKTAAQELRGGTQDVTAAPITATSTRARTGATTVTAPTSATTAAPPGVRGGMVVKKTPITNPTPGTPSGGGGTGNGGKGARVPRQPVSPDAWKDILRQRFPAYSNDWLTDNAVAHFGQDVIDLMVAAANPNGEFKGLQTEASIKAFELRLAQTNYFLNTASAAKAFDQSTPGNQKTLIDAKKLELKNELGDIGLDETTLNALAADAARKGLTGLGLTQAAYSYILKPTDQPSKIATRAMEAADADRIRAIGRAYNYNVSDAELKSILTGAPTAAGVVLTEEGLRQKAQNWAKGAMPQLADQIDRGLTLEEIGGNYQKYAAQILEQPEDKIDMFSGPYLQAFGTKETGQMSLGDWIERLKSDSRFGWQYTKQANQQATDVALSIARAFGKVQ
jgi:hypothetical protein